MNHKLQPANDWRRENFTRLPTKKMIAWFESGEIPARKINTDWFVIIKKENESENLLNKILQG